MDLPALKQQLQALLPTVQLLDWELDEQVEKIVDLPEAEQAEILRQAAIIYPVSTALCFTFLSQAKAGLGCLHRGQLAEWVKAILDVYEEDGLHQAGLFMAEVASTFVCRMRGEDGLRFAEVVGRLRPYLQGLAGRNLEVAAAPEPYTDTTTVFLPQELVLFKEKAANFLLYKLIASYQWALIAVGTFKLEQSQDEPWLVRYCADFPDPLLAAELYFLGQLFRARQLLARQLPGLLRDCAGIFPRLCQQRPPLASLSGAGQMVEALKQTLLAGTVEKNLPPTAGRRYRRALALLNPLAEEEQPRALTAALYQLLGPAGDYHPTPPLPFQGQLNLAAAWSAMRLRQAENKKQFISGLAAILAQLPPHPPAEKEASPPASPPPPGDGVGLLITPGAPPAPPTPEAETTNYITLADEGVSLPEALQELAAEIEAEFGGIPANYIASARQLAGKSYSTVASPPPQGPELKAPILYDEWDFRRQGFRKNWCALQEKTIQPTKGTFVATTMAKHRGLVLQLRRQFEAMRPLPRPLKRQTDGDEIDLDTLVDSLADSRAGLLPEENLYQRLTPHGRDISTIFLIDMSLSTEGWISTAIKEALVLICEALQSLGDSYAIHGFSGMRRSRSELYRIKGLEEPYNETVKGRIAAITPKEYTRMGPPIRHLIKELQKNDSKIRLLVILSDGKPEDYDDYKGEYAIEDTRHALLEAKQAGIHPFCITIDQQAHDYVRHLFGEVNYICINEIKQLPRRLPEIYRLLTT